MDQVELRDAPVGDGDGSDEVEDGVIREKARIVAISV